MAWCGRRDEVRSAEGNQILEHRTLDLAPWTPLDLPEQDRKLIYWSLRDLSVEVWMIKRLFRNHRKNCGDARSTRTGGRSSAWSATKIGT